MDSYSLDHIGIAVPDLDAALAEYQKNFPFEMDVRQTIESQQIELAFLKMENTLLEFIAPTSAESPLQKFLKNRGSGLHHLCYRVDDIRTEMKRLESQGHILIDQEPRPGAHGSLIAFIHPKTLSGVLTELCEYPVG